MFNLRFSIAWLSTWRPPEQWLVVDCRDCEFFLRLLRLLYIEDVIEFLVYITDVVTSLRAPTRGVCFRLIFEMRISDCFLYFALESDIAVRFWWVPCEVGVDLKF